MSNSSDGEHPPPPSPASAELSPELQAALRQAVNQSLGSLDSLRIKLRQHVHAQRRRGVSLGDIDAQLRKLMAAADSRADGDGVSDALATQIARWTRSFFSGTPS